MRGSDKPLVSPHSGSAVEDEACCSITRHPALLTLVSVSGIVLLFCIDSVSRIVRDHSALAAMVCMTVLALLRLTLYWRTFLLDGHRYRFPGACRPMSHCCHSYPCASSDETAQRLQPVTSPTQLLAQRKLEIHGLVFLALAVDIPFYANGYHVLDNPWSSTVFPLHVLSVFLLYCAFCIFLNILVKFVHLERRMKCLRWLLVATIIAFVPIASAVVVDCIGTDSFSEFVAATPFSLFIWYTVGVHLLIAAMFLVAGILLQRRVWNVLGPQRDTHPDPNFWMMLCRLNFVTLCCTVCFLVRAVMLARVAIISNRPGLLQTELGFGTWEWLMYEQWITTTVPCLALLYLWRDAAKAGPPALSRADGDMALAVADEDTGQEEGFEMPSSKRYMAVNQP